MNRRIVAVFLTLAFTVLFISSVVYAGAPMPEKPKVIEPQPEPEPAPPPPPPPPPPAPEEPKVEEQKPGCCLWPF